MKNETQVRIEETANELLKLAQEILMLGGTTSEDTEVISEVVEAACKLLALLEIRL